MTVSAGLAAAAAGSKNQWGQTPLISWKWSLYAVKVLKSMESDPIDFGKLGSLSSGAESDARIRLEKNCQYPPAVT